MDSETGLYNYGARYYDPRVSVWTGVDPLVDQRNWLSPYNYVQNNPIMRIDPTGTLDEPPVDGLEFFADDSGSYYWNKENKGYDHFYTKEGNDQVQKGTYSANGPSLIDYQVTSETLNKREFSNTIVDGIVIFGKHPAGILDGAQATGNVSTMYGLPLTPGKTKNSLSKGIGIADKLLELYGSVTDATKVPNEGRFDHLQTTIGNTTLMMLILHMIH